MAYFPHKSMWVNPPGSSCRLVCFGNGSTCCFASVHATQSGLVVWVLTLKPSTMLRSYSFCRLGYPTWPKRLCQVSQLKPFSWPRNVVDPSLVVVLVDLPFLSVVRLILYRCLPIFFPSATCFPSLLVSTSLPLPPLYCPPAASHLPREMRLYFWSGICRTSCKRSLYFFPLHVEIKSTVPRPAILATRPPMPVTDKSVVGTYEVKASLW